MKNAPLRKNKFLFLFFLIIPLYANKANIYNLYKYLSLKEKDFKISPKIMLSIIKTESDFEKNAILLNAKIIYTNQIYNFLKQKGYKVKKFKHYISIYPSDNRKKALLKFVYFLKNKKFIKTYDLGLMQINEKNFKNFKEQIEIYVNPKKNIEFGAKVLYKCFKKYKNTYKGRIKTFECYNKGFNDEAFNGKYFRKFINNYKLISKKFR